MKRFAHGVSVLIFIESQKLFCFFREIPASEILAHFSTFLVDKVQFELNM